MPDKYHQYDLVKTKDDVWCAVLAKSGLSTLIVHPKYIRSNIHKTTGMMWSIDGQAYDRISNPLDISRANTLYVSKYLKPYKSKDYLLLKKNIADHRSVFAIRALLKEKNSSNAVRKHARDLIMQISKYIPLKYIGLTGSCLLHAEITAISDIDLVIHGSQFKKFKNCILNKKISGIRLRTEKEWVQFYHHYAIKCSYDDHDFAQHMIHKPDQFIYYSIPVSTLFVSEQMALSDDPCSKKRIMFTAKVLDDSESMYLPGEYLVTAHSNKKILIKCLNRAFISQAENGDVITVSGSVHNHKVYISNTITDYIINKGWINNDKT